MPLQIPNLDDRRYQELLDEALARVSVHNPEWTNFNKSDPGVTLIEIFAFLTENLLYRSNQIPERNRRKFLSLLGVPLQSASSAVGLVQLTNERGPAETVTLNDGLEVRAGQVPFRTVQGLDVLPVEAQVFFKRKLTTTDETLTDYYKLLYASYNDAEVDDASIELYETVPLDSNLPEGVDIGAETSDGSLWVALLTRAGDKPTEKTEAALDKLRDDIRKAIAGRTISLGIVPALTAATRVLTPLGQAMAASTQTQLTYEIPNVSGGTVLPEDPELRVAKYRPLDARAPTDVLAKPGVVEITLPGNKDELKLWTNLDPLEPGVGEFPPALEDTNLDERIVTWLRIRPSATAAAARLLWVGINTVFVSQRARVSNELLPAGTGAPDQIAFLSQKPVIARSVRLTVTPKDGQTRLWQEIDDLFAAGSEVPVQDARLAPGALAPTSTLTEVFTVNAESGEIRFGDGTHGKRPPAASIIRASYDYGVGMAGNVGANSINSSPALPAGFRVSNPVRTWNGADAESVTEGEKQITRYLQHRDRLVNATDFATVALRTPGIQIGRVEVLSAYNPALTTSEPGDAPGAVTLMVIPRYDAKQPDAPLPDKLFLEAICKYLDPRRLITTEVFLRGPEYIPIWVSVGISVVAGTSVAEVREAVKLALLQFLSPLPPAGLPVLDTQAAFLTTPQYAAAQQGWPLRKSITDRELLAVASRQSGVLSVKDVLIARGSEVATREISLNGLQLPRVAGISVQVGDPLSLDSLRGNTSGDTTGGTGGGKPKRIVPVPFIPEEC
ncbi:MAG TPA: baseplate J/gp47 family protein [Pyrinomonadaceae bacterium]|nr:baseplate J/gp47 family protein [Pyrinomonadaceae bacterium]